MPGIYLTALITSVLAAITFGLLIHRLRLPADERLLALAALVALPLQPLAFYLVRMPFHHWLSGHLAIDSSLFQWITTLYAPLTEEPAKLIPLLIPAIRRDLRPANFARYALAIGLGFAIGEMWFIAYVTAQKPAFAHTPFYLFGGYVVERLMTCVFHSAFVSLSLWQWRRRFALGFAAAAAAHWLGNFPIALMAWKVGHLGQPAWALIVQLWLVFYLVGALTLLSFFLFGRFSPGRFLYGRRRCPECATEYDAPLLAFNFGLTRYERCPHCRHWHWTRSGTTGEESSPSVE